MKYTNVISQNSINTVSSKAIQALKDRNFEVEVFDSKEEALGRIKELIPHGASVMNGSSKTLEQIGFVDFLKSGQHGWNNLHEKVLAEKDPLKQGLLRKQTTVSDYYLGSVHALTEEGEMAIASNTGSQLPGIAFNSQNLIFVVGAQKIVPDLNQAFKRISEEVVPLENENMKQKYGMGTTWAKTLVLHQENPMMGRKVRVLIVKEHLGF